ncbi:MAG: hypothetical protein GY870_02045 [archaeon]|nr:hypothetical protein [archaeon]
MITPIIDEDGRPAELCYHGGTHLRVLKDVFIRQYIGRSDKKGEKMYTGDIIKWKKHKAIVKYSKEWCGYVLWNATEKGCEDIPLGVGGILPEECEIIGNEDENPELLK